MGKIMCCSNRPQQFWQTLGRVTFEWAWCVAVRNQSSTYMDNGILKTYVILELNIEKMMWNGIRQVIKYICLIYGIQLKDQYCFLRYITNVDGLLWFEIQYVLHIFSRPSSVPLKKTCNSGCQLPVNNCRCFFSTVHTLNGHIINKCSERCFISLHNKHFQKFGFAQHLHIATCIMD